MSKKLLSRLSSPCVIAFLFILLVCFVIFRLNAKKIGTEVGEGKGRIVGTAVGSLRGFTEGAEQGARDGKEAGLSAEDTQADIVDSMRELGKLEVLTGKTELHLDHEIGDRYAKLENSGGTVVFSVDLNQASITENRENNTISIILPEPTLDLYLDMNSSQVIAERQGFSLTHSTVDGVNAYLNSLSKTVERARECIYNYDSLMEMARNESIRQVELLAEAICGQEKTIDVGFR